MSHWPIVGPLIRTLVLIARLLLKKSEVKLTAFGIYIFSAFTAIAAIYTGEEAEEIVENFGNQRDLDSHPRRVRRDLSYPRTNFGRLVIHFICG